MRRRRRLTKIVLLLLALASGGAIVNVAVAWGCSAYSGQPEIDATNSKVFSAFDVTFQWMVNIAHFNGLARIESNQWFTDDPLGNRSQLTFSEMREKLPPWCDFDWPEDLKADRT